MYVRVEGALREKGHDVVSFVLVERADRLLLGSL